MRELNTLDEVGPYLMNWLKFSHTDSHPGQLHMPWLYSVCMAARSAFTALHQDKGESGRESTVTLKKHSCQTTKTRAKQL